MKSFKVIIAVFAVLLAAFVTYKFVTNKQVERLDVYNWPYYLDRDILAKFEKEHNCKVNYKEFPTNEDLLNDIENTSTKWDVIFPTDYMVEIMISRGLLSEIDKSKLTNFENLDDNFLYKSYDIENKYSLPFGWACTGIGYNKSQVKDADSYKIFWDEQYKNRIGLLDDIRFTIAMPLLMRGYSINTTNKEELSDIESLLLKQKPLVKAYNSDNYIDLLKSGEVHLVYGYGTDIIQASRIDPNLSFVIPKEGGVLYIDNMCIPKKSDNKELAHKFIDFLLNAENAANIINEKWFVVPNKAAKSLVNKEILNNEGVFPPDSVLLKCQMLHDLGDEIRLYENIWKRLKQ